MIKFRNYTGILMEPKSLRYFARQSRPEHSDGLFHWLPDNWISDQLTQRRT